MSDFGADLVTQDECGLPVHEWWTGGRKLTVYEDDVNGLVSYVKTWGANIDTEMEDGGCAAEGIPALVEWVRGGEA